MELEYLDVDGRQEPRPNEAMSAHVQESECIFCQLIRGDVAHFKIMESPHWLAVLDNRPLSDQHTLILSKQHGHSFSSLPLASTKELGVFMSQLTRGLGDGGDEMGEGVNYNLLLNHGRLAHQFVEGHVHWHLIPKPSSKQGLQFMWLQERVSKDHLALQAQRLNDHLK